MILFHFILALLYVNFLEWTIHRFILHGLGIKKKSFWSFHWHRHHRVCRKLTYLDPDYQEPMQWHTTGKEAAGLALLVLLHLPVLWWSWAAFAGLVVGAGAYYVLHSYSHRHPAWAKKYLRWHYDHHQGGNQHANYCVTLPVFDYIFRTRVKYDDYYYAARSRRR